MGLWEWGNFLVKVADRFYSFNYSNSKEQIYLSLNVEWFDGTLDRFKTFSRSFQARHS